MLAHTRPGRANSPCVSVALQLHPVLTCIVVIIVIIIIIIITIIRLNSSCVLTSFMLWHFGRLHMLKQLAFWLLKGYASSYLACCGLNFC